MPKKVKPDDHYYFSTASKICSWRQTHHGKYIPMEFDKKSPEYQIIIEMIQKARTETTDPIYIPARACKLYFAEYQETPAPKTVKLICPDCGRNYEHPADQFDNSGTWPRACPNCTPAPLMVATEAGTQYSFDVPDETQLALF